MKIFCSMINQNPWILKILILAISDSPYSSENILEDYLLQFLDVVNFF